MKKEEVVEILKEHGFILDQEKLINHGVQLVFRNGAIVCVYHTGKINVQGQHFEVVSELLGRSGPNRQASDPADDEF